MPPARRHPDWLAAATAQRRKRDHAVTQDHARRTAEAEPRALWAPPLDATRRRPGGAQRRLRP